MNQWSATVCSEALVVSVPVTAEGSSMPSTSVAGRTFSLKLLRWLGQDRN